MLPLPGSPAATWSLYRARLRASLERIDLRSAKISADAPLGLINNVLYVVILSAALDLVGPAIPKGVVLLADVVPGACVKLVAPYFIHHVPYSARVLAFVALSASGMLLVALTPESKDGGTVAAKMVGVVLASLSSGGGELSFLGLTHYYGHSSLASWSSGTGGAGLVGAAAYVASTTWLGWSIRSTLVASAFLPVFMLVTFFFMLPLAPLWGGTPVKYEGVSSEDSTDAVEEDDTRERPREDEEGLLRASGTEVVLASRSHGVWAGLKSNLLRTRHLILPMLPLFLVYTSEYIINQGVAPTLLFPLSSAPFKHYRDFYPTYNSIYQTGVFISRSSTPFFRVHNLYLPSFLQCLNLLLLTLHALFDFLPNVYVVFLIVFWEGLLGGLVYVNTFAEITDNVPREDREFSLGATSVSDSVGICVAGFVGMALEVWLCGWQVARGRDYCRKL
ncbi:MAG: battenin CLN3 protein [Thelocarpon impressellum]|nr:MAG: battenin CLN3 protein [Thelocarpon impressellum]